MRSVVIGLFLLSGYAMFQETQSNDPDVYSLSMVARELQSRSGDTIVIHSWTQKRLARLGDGVGIALLKILSDQDLQDEKRIRSLLPIIHDSFVDPGLISLDSDKKPKVTLFLLHHLRERTTDPLTQKDIDETISFISAKTSG